MKLVLRDGPEGDDNPQVSSKKSSGNLGSTCTCPNGPMPGHYTGCPLAGDFGIEYAETRAESETGQSMTDPLRAALEDIREFVVEEPAREGAGLHFAISQVRVLDYIDLKLRARAADTARPGLRAAAQAILDAALDSGFPRDEIDSESSYAQSVTLRGRDLADLRAALSAADTARPGLDVEALAKRLHDDPALCKRYSPHGHPRWWRNPPCRQIAARLTEARP